MKYRTPQEQFWASEFGVEYMGRNDGTALLESKTSMFRKVLQKTPEIRSVVEFGCNIGINLVALSRLVPDLALHGIEINPAAAAAARERLPNAQITEGSIFDSRIDRGCDLAFTCGVLIHLNPDMLPVAYAKLAAASCRFVLIAEYYSPTPVTVNYRGHENRLFKRDFAGEFLDANPAFRLVEYGFVYRRDPVAPLDDLTWFLMEQ